jgi:hypothetical protein
VDNLGRGNRVEVAVGRVVRGELSRFDDVVAVSMAVVLGVAAFFLVGMEVFAYALWVGYWLGPLLLGVGALGGVLMVVRGRRSARGFGAGMVVGWVLLALWTSGMSVGLYSVQDGFSWW